MTDITPLISRDRQIIQSYAQGKFKVSGAFFETPILVFPAETMIWPAAGRDPGHDSLVGDEAALRFLLEKTRGLDVVLLGSGASAVFVPPSIRARFREQGTGLEVMDTGAACRTYNVLMAEDRRVAAALLPL